MTEVVKNLDELYNINTVLLNEGYTVYVEDIKEFYSWNNGKWNQVKSTTVSASGISMSAYELNQSIINQMDDMDATQLNDLKDTINAKCNKIYYLLYGKEISYFTLFERKEVIADEDLGTMVLKCLEAFDGVKTFEVQEDGAIEIWVKYEDYVTVLYLFDYSDGVVYYG